MVPLLRHFICISDCRSRRSSYVLWSQRGVLTGVPFVRCPACVSLVFLVWRLFSAWVPAASFIGVLCGDRSPAGCCGGLLHRSPWSVVVTALSGAVCSAAVGVDTPELFLSCPGRRWERRRRVFLVGAVHREVSSVTSPSPVCGLTAHCF